MIIGELKVGNVTGKLREAKEMPTERCDSRARARGTESRAAGTVTVNT